MSSSNPIADARVRLVSAALILSDAVAGATREAPFDSALLTAFREARAELDQVTANHRRPHRGDVAGVDVGPFTVAPGEDGSSVVLANSRTRSRMEPDHARGLAAALTATAEHIDKPRQLRRRRDVDDMLRAREN